jgi:hypothetical protein
VDRRTQDQRFNLLKSAARVAALNLVKRATISLKTARTYHQGGLGSATVGYVRGIGATVLVSEDLLALVWAVRSVPDSLQAICDKSLVTLWDKSMHASALGTSESTSLVYGTAMIAAKVRRSSEL